MKDLIKGLEDLKLQLRNFQGHLRGEEWPSRSIGLTANDLSTWLGMAASTAETLIGVLVALEEAKVEVKEIIEEEKGGKVPSEPVREPEDREAGDKVPPQEPGDEEPEGD